MSGRWGWLGAAAVASLVVAFLFVLRRGSCSSVSDGPNAGVETCTSTPMLGYGLTWTFAVLIGLFVAWCVVHMVAPRR